MEHWSESVLRWLDANEIDIHSKIKSTRKTSREEVRGRTQYNVSAEFPNIVVREKTKNKIVYNRRNTMFNLLRNDKDSRKCNEFPGVYEIPFKYLNTWRDEIYIGYTSHSLQKRLLEHQKDTAENNEKTSLAQWLANFDTVVNWDDAKIVKKIDDSLVSER